MFFYYINNIERSDDIVGNTLRLTNQLQQKVDSCTFEIMGGQKPVENQEVKIYDGALVESHTGKVIVLKDSYQTDVQAFRSNQALWLKIGDSSAEKAIVDTYDESTKTITLVAIPAVTLSANDKIGELKFGGTVARVADQNDDLIEIIRYSLTCTDYTKIFDKKQINDSWANADGRYIINDFLNTTVNYNRTLDNLSYDTASAIRSVWIESQDGNNPNIDTTDFMESDSSAVFAWTNSIGTASFAGGLVSKDVSEFVGALSGNPTKGKLMFWTKTSDQADITSFKIRIGSSITDYAEFDVELSPTTDWEYHSLDFVKATIVGTPDYTDIDDAEIVIVQTGNGQILMNGLRINHENSFTMFNVEPTPPFDDLRAPQQKPMSLINTIAKTWDYIWFIDYERDIHLKDSENSPAPFEITDTSDNFSDLKIEADVTNVGNRIIVKGGELLSTSFYRQVEKGNNAVREWVLKNKFANLSVSVDDNTSTDTMEAGTTTTNVKATGHGLATGDHIINRTRDNSVREIVVVDNDNFTVEAVPGQTTGDTFSKFSIAKTVGIEGLVDEASVDYVYNSNEKSVRATTDEHTLIETEYIRFQYKERVPIQFQYADSTSINYLKSLGFLDGIFDLDTITDKNITDLGTAISLAEAKVREFGNAIINGSFITEQKGLEAGQLLHVSDSINRNIDDYFIIQKVSATQKDGRFKDNVVFNVTFGTTVFGWVEFMQKLLKTKDSIEINVDQIVETYAASLETVEAVSVDTVALGGIKKASNNETAEAGDVNDVILTTTPWKWETSVGQPLKTRWGKFEWS